jgi:UTP:GlnB (protein PII) uridylyltransferase
MTQNRDQLLEDLNALTEEQIEAGLAAGVWSEWDRPLVQHYLYQMTLARIEAAAEQLVRSTNNAAQAAVEDASAAKLRATAAMIIAGGAMLAAMASAFIAFLALRGFEAPW